jgi:hypothetical protein
MRISAEAEMAWPSCYLNSIVHSSTQIYLDLSSLKLFVSLETFSQDLGLSRALRWRPKLV